MNTPADSETPPSEATQAESAAPTGASAAPSGTSAAASSLAARLRADLRRMAALALAGCLAVALFELPAALITTPAPDVRALTALRLVLLDATLLALLWLALVPVLGLIAMGARLGLALGSRERALAWPGVLAPRPRTPDAPAIQPLAAWLWAGLAGVAIYLGTSALAAYRVITYFKEKQLTSLLLAVISLLLIAVAVGITYLIGQLLVRAARGLDRRLPRRLRRLSPLGHSDAAVATMLILGALGLEVLLRVMPQLRPLIPWRHILAAGVFAVGVLAGRSLLARRGSLLPRSGPRRRLALSLTLGIALVLVPLTLSRVGADHEAKSVAMTGSPLLSTLIDLVRKGTDIDRDGYGFLLGENDCAPFNGTIYPLARDVPDNGIDEDCNGRDVSSQSFRAPPTYRKGERLPVPQEFLRDWNILLLTVDTVRYDHTGFGGYLKTRGRDTTPELDKLVARSVSFTFANSPSAGTMASVPAIITSRFFHSGIALDEKVKPRMPPRLKPENTLIAELLKQKGYYTGAILTHEYFNDWGMEQGFDTYDNELGKVPAPFKITSHDVTDKAIAWIAHAGNRKWFLWAHYIDPHGRYVPHPGERSFGTTEEDLYDGELYYTDKHIGRLLRRLAEMPGADRTIIIITSDHGDGFGEHGFINHGQALYRELLHVPLIFHVPDAPARTVDGAVSALDIVPTVCDLAGIDCTAYDHEGESLVPQIFYGKDAHHRVVFAETNWPQEMRAAITSKYKLIFKLKANLYELYDLTADPWEKRNIYSSADKAVLAEMKGYLDDWLERVFYARDTVSNQTAGKLADTLLDKAPKPQQPVTGASLDNGHIEILGIDTDRASYKPGDKAEVSVYFRVAKRPSGDFRLQVQAWMEAPASGAQGNAAVPVAPGPPAQSKLKLTADGLFPTSRWRESEIIRDRFQVTVPPAWSTAAGDGIRLGLRVVPAGATPAAVRGVLRSGSTDVLVLGSAGLER